jgi:hypothetical protein
MTDTKELQNIESKILTIRNQQVMVDRDLAELYGVETKVLNQAVKRNIERFPEKFMFQLNDSEFEVLRSQIVTSKNSKIEKRGGRQYLPYAFTEQGVAMLSAVLKSEQAIKASILIMKAFVAMRHFLQNNAQIFTELDQIKRHQLESDKKIEELFTKMDKYGVEQVQGIFFQGQIFDAYSFFQKLIQKAKNEIILIDGYVDISVLDRLSKKNSGVKITIYTLQNPKMKNPLTQIDIQKFNAQYPTLTVNYTTKMHDRFLIIDNQELYHIGASLKDLGKTCFGFELMSEASVLIPAIMKNI